ncbi:alpha-L-fucosidase [Echinicola strongylocentroti]|uniref:alpha-L-fucosidase n=1 Tax=Echinicola strongylocentroti TaxID=1795355 RepID=A0A2Z4IGP1_9BACT|nr:alpha-L-fucosidase [Echinicola strongylocentroti]AWW30272.1 alpha-L-fucosidase [Echinicola strongylocentroti]
MKNWNKALLTTLLYCLAATRLIAQTPTEDQKMEWFADAKLGIFIHWGIYAVNGIDESWSFFNDYISYDDYMKQLDGFTASNYNPEKWAQLIKSSGAKYAVITAKHHDGVALWDSKVSNLTVVKKTPAHKDLIAPFMKALEKEGIKKGIYYSVLDWSHPDYDRKTRTQYRYKNDPERFQKFVDFNFKQLEELSLNFNPDLYWFDGDWEHKAEEWRSQELKDQLLKWNPNVIVNSRIGGHLGDYDTPEQGVPVTKPNSNYWELCLTMNNSWGYQHNDDNYKSPNELLRIFVDCLHMGGNLLLDMGPKPDGTTPDEAVNILESFGRWTDKHAAAIYDTQAGIPEGHVYAPTTLSKDRKTLYIYLDYKVNESLVIKGLKNKINRVWVVGNGTKLDHREVGKQYWSKVPGLKYIDIPDSVYDKDITVIAVLLDDEVNLYREKGQVIESN